MILDLFVNCFIFVNWNFCYMHPFLSFITYRDKCAVLAVFLKLVNQISDLHVTLKDLASTIVDDILIQATPTVKALPLSRHATKVEIAKLFVVQLCETILSIYCCKPLHKRSSTLNTVMLFSSCHSFKCK